MGFAHFEMQPHAVPEMNDQFTPADDETLLHFQRYRIFLGRSGIVFIEAHCTSYKFDGFSVDIVRCLNSLTYLIST